MRQIHFDDEYIYMNHNGETLRQSLLWYPALRVASETVRKSYIMSSVGIHWREIDVDISFESFTYSDAEPKSWQRFFLSDPSIDLTKYASQIGIDQNKLYRYIHGLETPKEEMESLLCQKFKN